MTARPFHSDYEVIKSVPGMVWIRDLNLGNLSVTNDAERVCQEVNAQYPGSRIIYQDSEGDWDELVHDTGVFRTFKPARDRDDNP